MIQYNRPTVQYNTTQHNPVQYDAVKYNTIGLHYNIVHDIILKLLTNTQIIIIMNE